MSTPTDPAPAPKRTIKLKPEAISPDRPDPAARAATRRAADALTPAFFISLVVGSILAGLGHLRGWELVGLGGPIIVTILYPTWGWVAHVRGRPSLRERLGDNAYYLGFIFTQVALLMAFGLPVLLGQAIEGEDVLRGFGVAIGASMTGLVARTMLVQTGHTANENADIVEQEFETLAREVESLARGVSGHTRRIVSDLDGVASGLAAAREALQRDLEGWLQTTAAAVQSYDASLKGHAAAVDRAAGSVAEAGQDVERAMRSGQADFAERIHEAATALGQLQGRLQKQMTDTTQAVQFTAKAFGEGMSAVGQMQEGLQAQMTEASASVRTAVDSLSKTTAALQSMRAIDDLVSHLDDRGAKVGESVERLEATMHRATETMDRTVAEASDGMRRSIDQSHRATQDAGLKAAEQIHQTVTEAASAIDRAGAEAVEATRSAGDRVRDEAEARTRALGEDLQLSVKALEAVLSDFRDQLERIRV